MPTQLTLETNTEVELTVKQRQEMLLQFRQYQMLKQKLDEVKAQMDLVKDKIAVMREEVGVETVGINGFRITLVAPVRGVFNKELFIAEGGDLSVYNRSVELRPTKSYELITLPDDK